MGTTVESAWVRNTFWLQNFEGGYCALEGGVQPRGEQPRRVRVCLGGGGEELLEKYFHQGFLKCELRVHNTKSSLAGQ